METERETDGDTEHDKRIQAEMEDNGQNIQAESLVETDFDMESRGLQEGDGRNGSHASQSNGCCFDSAMVEQFVSMEAGQAGQQLSAL